MKTNKLKRIISGLLSFSVLVSQVPLSYTTTMAETTNATNTGNAGVNLNPDMDIDDELKVNRQANSGNYAYAVSDGNYYEEDLRLDKDLQYKGNELGLAIAQGSVDGALEYFADSVFEVDGQCAGFPYDSKYLDEIDYFKMWGSNEIKQDFKMMDSADPSVQAPELWETLLADKSISNSISASICAQKVPHEDYESVKIYTPGPTIMSSVDNMSSTTYKKTSLCNAPNRQYINITSGRYETNRDIRNIHIKYLDETAPQIKSIRNENNYLFVTMNEVIRYANPEAFEQIKDTYKPTITMADGSTTTAEIVGYKDDKTIVMYVDTDKYYQQNVNPTIKNIDFNKEVNISGPDTVIYGFENRTLKAEKKDSKVAGDVVYTDYAGNPLTSYDITSDIIKIDNRIDGIEQDEAVGNGVEKTITLNTTSLVASAVEVTVNTGEAPSEDGEASKKDLFLGADGKDTFTIKMEFKQQDDKACKVLLNHKDERYKKVYAITNIKDKNGDFVKVPLTLISNTQQQANHDATGLLIFADAKIEEGMYIENGEKIKVTGLGIDHSQKGNEYNDFVVYDVHGNPICSQSFDLKSTTEALVDGIAPKLNVVKTEELEDGTFVSTIQFTDFDRNNDQANPGMTSGMQGKSADIYLLGETFQGLESSQSVSYEYALSINDTVPSESEYTKATLSNDESSAKKMSIQLTQPQQATAKLYLKFDTSAENIVVQNVKIKATLSDVAGNTATITSDVESINIDKNPPIVTAQSVVVDYTTKTYKAIFNIKDTTLDGATASYIIEGEESKTAEINEETGLVEVTGVFAEGEVFEKSITLTATDKGGLTSTATQNVKVDAELALPTTSIESNVLIPNILPIVNITLPADKDDTTKASTRVTFEVNGNKYVTMLDDYDARTFNPFEFQQSKWVKVEDDGTNYTSVTALDVDGYLPELRYGEVTVIIESAYTSLTPVEGQPIAVADASTGYNKIDLGIVKNAPAVQAYNVENATVKTANDKDVEFDTVYNQTIAGMKVDFDVKNTLCENFAMTDIDFDNSFIMLQYKEDTDTEETTAYKTKLSNNTHQTFVAPQMDYETGIYSFKVVLTQKSGVAKEFSLGSVIVDNVKITDLIFSQMTTTSRMGSSALGVLKDVKYDIKYDADGNEDAVANEIYNSLKEVVMENADGSSLNFVTVNRFTNETDKYYDSKGASYTADNTYQHGDYDNQPIMYRETVQSAGSSYMDFEAEVTESTRSDVGNFSNMRFWTVAEDGTEKDYVNDMFSQSLEGEYFNNMQDDLGITEEGIYTIYYQVTMKNGNKSAVNSFELNYVSDSTTTTANFKYTVKGTTPYDGENIPNAYDVTFENAKSTISDVKIYRAYAMLDENGCYVISDEKVIYDIEEFEGSSTISTDDEGYNFLDINNNAINYMYETLLKEFYIVADKYGTLTYLIPYIGTSLMKTSNEKANMEYKLFDKNSYVNDFYTQFDAEKIDETGMVLANKDDASIVGVLPYENGGIFSKYYPNKTELVITDKDGNILGEKMPLLGYNNDNNNGYVGATTSDCINYDYETIKDGQIELLFANPIADDEHPVGTVLENKAYFYVAGKAGDIHETDIDINLFSYEGADEKYLKLIYQDGLVKTDENGLITFNTYAKINNGDLANTYTLPTDCNSSFKNIEVIDAYGKEYTIDSQLVDENAPTVLTVGQEFVDGAYTKDTVKLTFVHTEAMTITVPQGYEDFVTITGNGTASVVVECVANVELGITYNGGSSYYNVTNIDAIGMQMEKTKEVKPSIEFYQDDKLIDTTKPQTLEGEVVGKLTYTGLKGDYEEVEYLVDEKGDEVTFTFDEDNIEHTFLEGTYFDKYQADGLDFVVKLADYGITIDNPDVTKPSVQVTVSGANDSQIIGQDILLNVEQEENKDPEQPSLPTTPTGHTAYTDVNEFMENIIKAPSYIFYYTAKDVDETTVYFKNGTLTETPTDKITDTIDGVTIENSSIKVTKNAEFTMFVEDEKGNVTIIPFNVEVMDMDSLPVPFITQTANTDKTQVDVVVTPPTNSGITGFKVWDTAYEKDGTSYKIIYDANGNKTFNYSYYYGGFYTTGSFKYEVTEIASQTAGVNLETDEITYSYNYNDLKTNKDVSLTYTFNKEVKTVKVAEASKDAVKDILVATGSGEKVTFTFSDNITTATEVTITDTDNKTLVITLAPVTNIDKTGVDVTVSQKLSEYANYTTLTFKAEEKVTFTEGGTFGTEFTFKVKENSEYTYHFVDGAGNITEVPVTVSDIIDEELEMTFSLNGLSFFKDPNTLIITNTCTLHVKVNRASDIMFNNGEVKSVKANEAVRFSLADIENYKPSIKATDKYGYTAYKVLEKVILVDSQAPQITLVKQNVYVREDETNAKVSEKLLGNVIVSDNMDDNPTATVSFTINGTGKTKATYTAKDETGNTATLELMFTVTSVNEPLPTVDGEVANRDETIIIEEGEHTILANLPINGDITQPYKITYRSGIKTVAQMKNNAIVLVSGEDTNKDITVALLPGYYTFCVTTQDRDYYRFLVYVE